MANVIIINIISHQMFGENAQNIFNFRINLSPRLELFHNPEFGYNEHKVGEGES